MIKGLLQQLHVLDTLGDGEGKVGDGQPWAPPITVNSGHNGFSYQDGEVMAVVQIQYP